MKTYVYSLDESRVFITIEASDEDESYCLLEDRLRELGAMGVVLPPPWAFELHSAF